MNFKMHKSYVTSANDVEIGDLVYNFGNLDDPCNPCIAVVIGYLIR